MSDRHHDGVDGAAPAPMALTFEEMRLEPVAVSVGEARHRVRRTLLDSGRPGPFDDVELLVSELVTNAIEAQGGPVTLRIQATGNRVRLEVDDQGAGEPHLVDGSEAGGWGLQLVERLTDSWGCVWNRQGKTVWAEVQLPS